MLTPASPAAASSSLTRTTIREASTESTTPPRSAMTVTPESRATTLSIPVPTRGFSARRVGTAWRCMFEPMRARFASSCSRNGMSAAATETICRGDTSMYCTPSRGDRVNSFRCRQVTRSSMNRPSPSRGALAWAMTNCPSSIADRYSIRSVTKDSMRAAPSVGSTVRCSTFRYGVSMKPYSLVLA